MMRKPLVILLSALCGIAASAQPDRIDEIVARLHTERISLHYRCVLTREVDVQLSGTLLLQGACYQAKGNGVEIYCDGTTRWTVDPEAKEVYVERAGSPEELLAWRDSLSELELSEVRSQARSDDLSAFRFDTDDLDSEWIVTDLR